MIVEVFYSSIRVVDESFDDIKTTTFLLVREGGLRIMRRLEALLLLPIEFLLVRFMVMALC
jgi:hypothetical protein